MFIYLSPVNNVRHVLSLLTVIRAVCSTAFWSTGSRKEHTVTLNANSLYLKILKGFVFTLGTVSLIVAQKTEELVDHCTVTVIMTAALLVLL